MDIPSKFAGIYVHDHETALYHFGTGHAECNAHILRYLLKNDEEAGNQWSIEMAELLRTMNDLKKELSASGIDAFCKELYDAFSSEYDGILDEATEQNKMTKSEIAKKEEKSLINRLKQYKSNHLLFATRYDVPFTNNMSERDLRKCKNRQKVSGGFRKDLGKSVYCTLLSVIETCKRRGISFLDLFRQAFHPKFLPC